MYFAGSSYTCKYRCIMEIAGNISVKIYDFIYINHSNSFPEITRNMSMGIYVFILIVKLYIIQ